MMIVQRIVSWWVKLLKRSFCHSGPDLSFCKLWCEFRWASRRWLIIKRGISKGPLGRPLHVNTSHLYGIGNCIVSPLGFHSLARILMLICSLEQMVIGSTRQRISKMIGFPQAASSFTMRITLEQCCAAKMDDPIGIKDKLSYAKNSLPGYCMMMVGF